MSNRAPLLADIKIGDMVLRDNATDPRANAPTVVVGYRHLIALAKFHGVNICAADMPVRDARTGLSFCMVAVSGGEPAGALWIYDCVLDRPRGATPVLTAFPAPGLADLGTISAVMGHLLENGVKTERGEQWELEWRFPTRNVDHRWGSGETGALRSLASMSGQDVTIDRDTGAVQSIRRRVAVRNGSL